MTTLSIILIAIILIQDIFHRVERRDMLNRLMSKNLSDYRLGENKKPPEHIPSAHDRVLRNWRDKGGDKR